jgi:hypothetical protein
LQILDLLTVGLLRQLHDTGEIGGTGGLALQDNRDGYRESLERPDPEFVQFDEKHRFFPEKMMMIQATVTVTDDGTRRIINTRGMNKIPYPGFFKF